LRTRQTPEIGNSSAAAEADAPALACGDGPPLTDGDGPDPDGVGAAEGGATEGAGVVGDGMHPETTKAIRTTVAATSDPRGPMG